jgi:hypothetical protein
VAKHRAGKLQPSVGFISIEVRSVAKSKKFYEALAKALDIELVYEGRAIRGGATKSFTSSYPRRTTPG